MLVEFRHGTLCVSLLLGEKVAACRRMRGRFPLCHNPPSPAKAGAVSLRLGHITALTTHRVVIHYRDAATLPQGEALRLCRSASPLNRNLTQKRACNCRLVFFFILFFFNILILFALQLISPIFHGVDKLRVSPYVKKNE